MTATARLALVKTGAKTSAASSQRSRDELYAAGKALRGQVPAGFACWLESASKIGGTR